VKDKKLAGGIVLIARNGKVVVQEALDWPGANLDCKLRWRRHDLRIYSIEGDTSAVALTLGHEGKLDLDLPCRVIYLSLPLRKGFLTGTRAAGKSIPFDRVLLCHRPD